MISNILVFIMIAILILIYFNKSNIDGFEKIYNINVNSTSGTNNCPCNSNPDVIVPVYGPWKTYYPWNSVYPGSYPYNWNYPYYWSQNYFW